jgi:F1F0 ATPase subunit 2
MSGLSLAVFLVSGAALGAAYFLLLHRAVRLHAASAGALRIMPLHVLRAALAVAAFWIVAQQGALPLLLTLLGFLLARLLVQRRLGAL